MTVRRLRIVSFYLVLALAGAACVSDPAEAQAQPDKPATPAQQPTRFGEPFQLGVFANLNPLAGSPAEVDLGQVVGKKPVLLYYWIAGNPRADSVFQELHSLVEEVGMDKVALYGVVYQREERDAEAVADRVASLGIKVPVLSDEDFALGQRLRVQSVPDLTILDAEGRLRLTNGASMVQVLEYNMTLADAARRVAETGELATYGYLDPYFPVKELVGHKCPDFKAPSLKDSVQRSWSSLVKNDQLNVLIFWSVDCPHCRHSLPEINDWLKSNGDRINVVSAAKVTSEATKIKTREFCDLNGFVFPTLVDQDMEIATKFQVTSTPTILFIGPDGVIDSVMLSSETDFGRLAEEKKKKLL